MARPAPATTTAPSLDTPAHLQPQARRAEAQTQDDCSLSKDGRQRRSERAGGIHQPAGVESRDGEAHVACGVWEGPSVVGSGGDGSHGGDDEVDLGLLVPPNAFRAYGCALPAEAEVPDAELAAVILFLERCCEAAEAPGATEVHAIVAVDSEACLIDMERAWRLEDARDLQSVLFFATFKEQLTGIHVRRSTEDAAVTVCLSGSRKARQIIVHRVLPLPAPGAKVLG